MCDEQVAKWECESFLYRKYEQLKAENFLHEEVVLVFFDRSLQFLQRQKSSESSKTGLYEL